jgi:tetratricopeptide (TPR) repeat protein
MAQRPSNNTKKSTGWTHGFESALWLARLYRLRNEHDKAEEVLRSLLKEDPENDPAVEQLTQLLLDEGKSADAVSLLEGITSRNPSPTLLDLLGDAYSQTHDLSKAEGAYRKAVELDPSELSHQRGLGQTLLAEEKYPDALAVYLKLADLMPDDSDVYLRLAQIYRELHQLEHAEEYLLKARQYAPGSVEVMYNEAMLYEAQGRFEDAIRVLSDAVTGLKSQSTVLPSRRRSLAILYQQLGQLYRDAQNFQAAVFTYEELGHLGEEEDRRARMLIMDTYRAAKNLPKALQTGKEALAKYPSDPGLRTSNALLLGENGQTDEAVKILRSQLTKSEGDRDIYLNIAQVYERGRRYQEAEAAALTAEAIPGQPRDNEMVWFLLGAIYERQKLFDRAEVEFKKTLEVNPKNAPVLNYYGYMLGDLGLRLDEAEALVQRALKEEPNSGAYLDNLGWIYFRENKLAKAEATLLETVARESHDATIRSHLGDVYARIRPVGSCGNGMGKVPDRMALAARGHGKRQSGRNRKETFSGKTPRGSKILAIRPRNLNKPHARSSHPRVCENQSAPRYSWKTPGWLTHELRTIFQSVSLRERCACVPHATAGFRCPSGECRSFSGAPSKSRLPRHRRPPSRTQNSFRRRNRTQKNNSRWPRFWEAVRAMLPPPCSAICA